MLRSVVAILAGFITTAMLAIGTDALLHSLSPGSFRTEGEAHGWILWAALAYTVVFGIAGAYVTARLAPRRPVQHALILGSIALVLSIFGAIKLWATTPAWYHVLTMLLILPAAWCGGIIGKPQTRDGAASSAL
jgi:hypothetical protein